MDNADYHIDQFLFIDESHVNDRTLNRKYGYSFQGERAVFRQLFSRGNRYTVTAALDMYGIVDYTILSGNIRISYLCSSLT